MLRICLLKPAILQPYFSKSVAQEEAQAGLLRLMRHQPHVGNAVPCGQIDLRKEPYEGNGGQQVQNRVTAQDDQQVAFLYLHSSVKAAISQHILLAICI